MDALFRQPVRRVQGLVCQNAVGHDHGVVALSQHRHRLIVPISGIPLLPAPGIANRHRAGAVQHGPPQHGPQLRKAGG